MGLCDGCGLSFDSEDELILHKKHTTCGNRSKNHESGRKSKTVVSCQDCDKTFTRKGSLMRHAREVHNKYDASSHARECGACPICKESLQNYSAVVIKHLRIVHSISVEVEEKLFPSLEEFYKWKHDIETETLSFYAKYSADGDRHYYLCHRAGKSRGKDTEGSLKTGTSCPAKIAAQVKGSNVKVVWYKTHVGHENSVEFLKLKKHERAMIADWIEEGYEYDDILDNIKEMAIIKSPTLERIHLLKKSDLHNIAKEFGIDKTDSPSAPKRARVCAQPQVEECEESLLDEQTTDAPISIKSPSADEANTGDMKKLMRNSLKTLYELFRKCSPERMSNILREIDRLTYLARSDIREDIEEVQKEEKLQILPDKVENESEEVMNQLEEVGNQVKKIEIKPDEEWNQCNKSTDIEKKVKKYITVEISDVSNTSLELDHSYALPFKKG